MGQGYFSALSVQSGSGNVHHLDVSSGLGPSELGIFAIDRVPATAAPSLLPKSAEWSAICTLLATGTPYFVGYFRPEPGGSYDAGCLARLVYSFVALHLDVDWRHLVVFGPKGAHASSFWRELAGLTGVSTLPGTSTEDSGRLTIGAGTVHVEYRDIFDAHLSILQFRCLLHSASACIVTGDASLGEAICGGVPFWYAAPGHKRDVAADLQKEVQRWGEGGGATRGPEAAAIVQAWWQFVGGVKKAVSTEEAWKQLLVAVNTAAADGCTLWSALTTFSGDLAARHASLGEKIMMEVSGLVYSVDRT
jgi:hypothetical protein